MKQFLLSLFMILTPMISCAQIHSSLDVVNGFNFINEISCCSDTYASGINGKGSRYGLNFNVRIYEKSILKTGARYVNQSFFSIQNLNESIKEYYLEIPLMLRYEFGSGVFTPYLEAGISPHIFLGGELIDNQIGQVVVEDYDIEYLEGRRFRLTTSVALGFQLTFSKRFQIFAQPTVRYFKPLSSSSTFSRVSIINMGLEVGFRTALSFVGEEWY